MAQLPRRFGLGGMFSVSQGENFSVAQLECFHRLMQGKAIEGCFLLPLHGDVGLAAPFLLACRERKGGARGIERLGSLLRLHAEQPRPAPPRWGERPSRLQNDSCSRVARRASSRRLRLMTRCRHGGKAASSPPE